MLKPQRQGDDNPTQVYGLPISFS